MSFFLILLVGYVYIWRKGVLDWGLSGDRATSQRRAAARSGGWYKRYRYGTRN